MGDVGSNGEGREGTLSHISGLLYKCNNANQYLVVYRMMREMIYGSFIP
jgi:hypothetical protein